jgi:hypothetical protein
MADWDKDQKTLEEYKAAAEEIRRQARENPDIPIPVDPDVADFMGAFEEPSVSDEDFYPDQDYLTWLKENHGEGEEPKAATKNSKDEK